jgi:hypothetical protein
LFVEWSVAWLIRRGVAPHLFTQPVVISARAGFTAVLAADQQRSANFMSVLHEVARCADPQ